MNQAVIGAAGKMGRGIALLLLQQKIMYASDSRLDLVEKESSLFPGLKQYLYTHLSKQIDKESLDRLFHQVFWTKSLDALQETQWIFESIPEKVDLKVKVMREIAERAPQTYVWSNTSAIPIETLATESGLYEKLIGFHFFNPPHKQPLIEIIPSRFTDPQLIEEAFKLAKKMGKESVVSGDVAGFISNGFFSAEILYACELVEEWTKEIGTEAAITFIDQATRDWLVRPMGIFQLIDYVGLDIVLDLLQIIQPQARSTLLLSLASQGIYGGQTEQGLQKNGFFAYADQRPVQVYSTALQSYIPFTPEEKSPFQTWKQCRRDPQQLEHYFNELRHSKSKQASLALNFLTHSYKIQKELVARGVAKTMDDCATVLKAGFSHLYSPHEFFETAVAKIKTPLS